MRSRAIAFAINTQTKKQIVDNTQLAPENDEKASQEILAKYIMSHHLNKKDIRDNASTHNIKLPPPKYMDIGKYYQNKNNKPLKFHERGHISHFDPSSYADINESKVEINFNKLLAMFDNEEEINEVDIEKLLKVDYEKLGEFKDKLGQIVEFVKSRDYDDEEDNKTKNEVIDYLNAKLANVKMNEDNIENAIFNVEHIDKIVYGKLNTKIYFNKAK